MGGNAAGLGPGITAGALPIRAWFVILPLHEPGIDKRRGLGKLKDAGEKIDQRFPLEG